MSTTIPKAVVSWSSGKDSAFALHAVRSQGEFEVVGVLTTLNETYGRVAMHGVRDCLLERQLEALGLPALRVMLPHLCTDDIYQQRMAAAFAELRTRGVQHIIFGDLFLEDIRAYREAQLARAAMQGVFPLWRRDTAQLAREMIASGLEAYLVCVDPRRLGREFAGRPFDRQLLADLPPAVDPCGENGEFHTVVCAGPMFRAPIAVEVGEVVEREGFVFADVALRPQAAAAP
jgi:uncharacterized protein (TIGR00290 family)